jgi:hypothetical protein
MLVKGVEDDIVRYRSYALNICYLAELSWPL